MIICRCLLVKSIIIKNDFCIFVFIINVFKIELFVLWFVGVEVRLVDSSCVSYSLKYDMRMI